jgi:hypothetical protein
MSNVINIDGSVRDLPAGFVEKMEQAATEFGYQVVYLKDKRIDDFLESHGRPIMCFVGRSPGKSKPISELFDDLLENLKANPRMIGFDPGLERIGINIDGELAEYQSVGGDWVLRGDQPRIPHMQRSGFLGRGQKGKPRTLAKGRG